MRHYSFLVVLFFCVSLVKATTTYGPYTGTDDATYTINNTSGYGVAIIANTSGTGSAVYGNSDGGYGVEGWGSPGVMGRSTNDGTGTQGMGQTGVAGFGGTENEAVYYTYGLYGQAYSNYEGTTATGVQGYGQGGVYAFGVSGTADDGEY